jgi:hypothetical protein
MTLDVWLPMLALMIAFVVVVTLVTLGSSRGFQVRRR